MRNKIIVVLSVIILGALAVGIYTATTRAALEDYIEEPESGYKTEIDNHKFYAEEVTDTEAIDVSNMLLLLGVMDDAVVIEEPIYEDGDDFNRDLITEYCDDIDYSELVYSVIDGDTYYVWTDTSGNIRGLHLDAGYNLIELR